MSSRIFILHGPFHFYGCLNFRTLAFIILLNTLCDHFQNNGAVFVVSCGNLSA